MQIIERIVEALNSGAFQSGLFAKFVTLSDKIGCKLWRDKDLAQHQYNLQIYAYKHKLAPRPFPVFHFRYKNATYFGFLTEIVSIINPETMPYDFTNSDYHDSNYNLDFDMFRLPNLTEKLKKIGVKPMDLHHENIGYNRRGQLVVLDFGECRLTESTVMV